MSWNWMVKDSESMKRTRGPVAGIADPVLDRDHVAALDLEAGPGLAAAPDPEAGPGLRIGPSPGTVLNPEAAPSRLTEVTPRRLPRTGPNLAIVASRVSDPNHHEIVPGRSHATVQIPNQNHDLALNPEMIKKKKK